MPLYKEWEPASHALAAIWHIEEPEAFFGDKTGLISQIKHPRKRIEHLCGRHLLQHLREDFPFHHISPDVHDKPRLPGDRYFFSISHSYPYVAAIISDKEECGIDIQVWKDNISEIAHMYLSEVEQALCAGDSRIMTLAWAIKETAYKWWGRRGAAFIEDLPIGRILEERTASYPPHVSEPFYIKMRCFGHPIEPKALLYKDFALSYITVHRPKSNE